ncbi:MAG: isochorismatase family protein [Actinomycetota bacterium]|nr:isochorismatase family protein [Actinomycetota bacterium]
MPLTEAALVVVDVQAGLSDASWGRRNNAACEESVAALLRTWNDAALSISKQVHSAFYGEPDLHQWLQAQGLRSVAVSGITTDHCCETTTRMAGDLGYDTYLVLDATHTFDRRHPDGSAG